MLPAMAWLDLLVAVLLAVTVGYCFLLHRRLSALRGAQDQLHRLLADFGSATDTARQSIAALRSAGDQVGRELQQRVDAARSLCDELETITASGNSLADRLDQRLMERKEAVDSAVAARRPPLSESERELMEALRQVR